MSKTISYGPVRARDLRANIQEFGFETGAVMTLERMLDEHTQDRQHVRELVRMVDQCIDQIGNLAIVGEHMKRGIEQLKRNQKVGDAVDRNFS